MAEDITDFRTVNKAELARILDVSAMTINNWVTRGCPVAQMVGPNKKWAFNLAQVVDWRMEQAKKAAKGEAKSVDLDEAKRRKLVAEAEMAELDLEVRQGQLVEIEAVAKTVGDDYANMRAKLLSIPSKISPQLVGVESVTRIQSVLDKVVSEALEELISDKVYENESVDSSAGGEEEGQPQAAAEA